jgi:hypothetical protein
LNCDITFVPKPCISYDVEKISEDFPNNLTPEIASQILTDFTYNFCNQNTGGNGISRLRSFGLCSNQLARIIWENDPKSVCQILRVPNCSVNSCSKKSFEDIPKFCESILKVKYGYQEFYDFSDDPELKRLTKISAELNEKLRPHWGTINRCGTATLEKINNNYEDVLCEDGPGKLYDDYQRIEKQYDERYKQLVKSAKKKGQKLSPNRYDYLCKKTK